MCICILVNRVQVHTYTHFMYIHPTEREVIEREGERERACASETRSTACRFTTPVCVRVRVFFCAKEGGGSGVYKCMCARVCICVRACVRACV